MLFRSDNKTAVDTNARPAVGTGHARMRYHRARVLIPATGTTAADVIRLFTMKSADRIFELLVTSDGAGTALVCDLGLHRTGGPLHDGAVLDQDIFASLLAVNAAIARVDEFVEAGTLEQEDRGKQIWEYDGLGFTSDPNIQVDVTMTVTTANTTAANEIIVEAYFSGV